MTIDQKYVDLIHAQLDGEIDDRDRAELDAFIASNPDARELHISLQTMCDQLASLAEVEPPPHLQYAILDAFTTSKPRKIAASRQEFTMRHLFAAPVFRHAVAFAAGVFMTLALVNSNQISDSAFDDVTGLVGTITETETINTGPNFINVTSNAIAGTVSIHKSGSLTVVDFNLSAAGPVEIVAGFSKLDLWFKGFAQLENDGASVSANSGEVKMQMQGKNRYAMYLEHAGQADAAVNLKFYTSGRLIHEADLVLNGSAKKFGK